MGNGRGYLQIASSDLESLQSRLREPGAVQRPWLGWEAKIFFAFFRGEVMRGDVGHLASSYSEPAVLVEYRA